MAELEQTLDSREVAEMVEKEHKYLMRDIRRYIKQVTEGNLMWLKNCLTFWATTYILFIGLQKVR